MISAKKIVRVKCCVFGTKAWTKGLIRPAVCNPVRCIGARSRPICLLIVLLSV